MGLWDYTLVLWLNQLIAYNERTFFAALFLSDRVPWVLCSAVFVALWFIHGERMARSLDETQDPVYRNRLVVVTILLGAVFAFIVARILNVLWDRPRPLAWMELQVPIAPEIWQEVVTAVGLGEAFPSDHTAFWGAVTAGLFLISRRAGWAGVACTTFFAALRVALGYHYPSDMVAGFALGLIGVALAYAIRRRLIWLVNPFLQLFDHRPALMYAFAMLVLLDITQRFAWLFGLLAILFGVHIPG
ncbi:MAG: phosphatase PAP2 family protein [Chloroflexi bacterium]|nr:phosphatase PAP2 family protein [Chloroflexota bacterium]